MKSRCTVEKFIISSDIDAFMLNLNESHLTLKRVAKILSLYDATALVRSLHDLISVILESAEVNHV